MHTLNDEVSSDRGKLLPNLVLSDVRVILLLSLLHLPYVRGNQSVGGRRDCTLRTLAVIFANSRVGTKNTSETKGKSDHCIQARLRSIKRGSELDTVL